MGKMNYSRPNYRYNDSVQRTKNRSNAQYHLTQKEKEEEKAEIEAHLRNTKHFKSISSLENHPVAEKYYKRIIVNRSIKEEVNSLKLLIRRFHNDKSDQIFNKIKEVIKRIDFNELSNKFPYELDNLHKTVKKLKNEENDILSVCIFELFNDGIKKQDGEKELYF